MTFTLTIFLAFHKLLMMLVHMEVHSKYHILMWIQSKFEAGWLAHSAAIYCQEILIIA